MLIIRHITDTISKKEIGEPIKTEWAGLSVAELAPVGALACLVNDKTVKRSDVEWEMIPQDGSVLVYLNTDSGIEAAIFAFVMTTFTASVFTATVVAVTATVLINAAISMAISYALNALLAPSSQSAPQFSSGGGRGKNSGTYGFDSIRTRAQNGATIPVVYGEHATGGDVICSWREAMGNSTSQTLFMLVSLSEGEVQSIGQYTSAQDSLSETALPDGMKINGIDAQTFKDVQLSLRLGTSGQTVMPGFERAIIEYGQDFKLVDPDSIIEWTTRDAVNDIMINIVYPRGCFQMSDTGEVKKTPTSMRIQILETDGVTIVRDRTVTFKLGIQSPIFRTIYSASGGSPLEPRQYIVRFWRTYNVSDSPTKVDDITCIGILEIQNAPLAYPGLAVLGLRIRATDQLSGGTPSVLTVMKGRKVRTSFGSETESWSQNPAWIVRDMLTNKQYGMGALIADADIDQDSFEEFADYCSTSIAQYTGSGTTEARHLYDGVFDTAQPGFDAALKVCATARAVLVKFGDTIKVKIENVKTALQMFTAGNVEQDSLAITYMSPKERYNSIEVSFLNAAKNYEQDQVVREVPDLDETTDSIRRNNIQLYGITRQSQAARAAEYLLRVELNTLRSITFKAGIDSVVTEPGDCFLFSNDMTAWNQSGRLDIPDASGMVRLDRKLEFEAGRTYRYIERNNADDAILTQDFALAGTYDTLPFAPLHGSTNVAGRVWIIGEKSVVNQKYLCTRITTDATGFKRMIEGIEYIDETYGDAADPIETAYYEPTPGAAPNPATSLAVVESIVRDWRSRLTVSWSAAAGAARYGVYSRPHGSGNEYQLEGETTGTSLAFDTQEASGTCIEIAVVTINSDGQRTDLASAPTVDYVLLRESEYGGDDLVTLPAVVPSVALSVVSGNTYNLTWGAVAGADGYEVRLGNWTEGIQLYRGTGTSVQVKLSRAPHRFCVRAYESYYFGQDNAKVESDATALAGYATLSSAGDVDIDSSSAVRSNCGPVDWMFETRALIQTDARTPMSFVSAITDLGSSAATHISVDCRVLAFITSSLSALDHWGTMGHESFFGTTHKDYAYWDCYAEYSVDGTTWSRTNMYDNMGVSDVTATARYFRIRFEANTLSVAYGSDDGTEYRRVARVLVEHLYLALYRA